MSNSDSANRAATPSGHKMGQKAKTCGFSRGFCHCGPFVEFGPMGGLMRNMLDVLALLAPGHFPNMAQGVRVLITLCRLGISRGVCAKLAGAAQFILG